MTPERYRNAKWEDVPAPIKEAVGRMIAGGKGIYIHGAVGTGKTHIAYAIKAHVEAQPGGWSTLWNVVDLMQEIKADFGREHLDKRRPEDHLADSRHPVLLDDIGAERATDFVAETLYRVVNARYVGMLPTVFTSNLALGELSDRIGERSASRIAEMCEVFNLTGGDRRLGP